MDPMDFKDSVNRYAAFAWDPVNLRDPWGMQAVGKPEHGVPQLPEEDKKPEERCRDAGSSVSPPGGLPWKFPGVPSLKIPDSDCPTSVRKFLSDEVHRLCDLQGEIKCLMKDSLNAIRIKIKRNRACINARLIRERVCFRGGNQDHVDQIDARRRTLAKCEKRKKQHRDNPNKAGQPKAKKVPRSLLSYPTKRPMRTMDCCMSIECDESIRCDNVPTPVYFLPLPLGCPALLLELLPAAGAAPVLAPAL